MSFFQVLVILFTMVLYSNGQQAVYFNGVNQYLSFDCSTFPSGNNPRTVEFWMRSNLRTNAYQNHESVVELGVQQISGSAFGIFTEISNGQTYFSFWGHNLDKRFMAKLYDDDWHFVALTYDGTTLRFYLDGTERYEVAVNLVTSVGTCTIGGNPGRGWYFQGAVRGLVIWNTVRGNDDIKRDMIPFYNNTIVLMTTEPGLVASFPLNEGIGSSFSNLGNTRTGYFNNNPTWTKAIASNPNPINEGIWFFIQNKNEVEGSRPPAQSSRMALTVDSQNNVIMAQVPFFYTLDYSAFLWKTVVLPNGGYRLINKKLGDTKALTYSQSQLNLKVLDVANSSVDIQIWTLKNSNKTLHGTNAYLISNGSKTLQYSNSLVTFTLIISNNTKQIWVFQPAQLVAGYHIASDNGPTGKNLTSIYGETFYATYTVSDWAILNAHLIITNMINAMNSSVSLSGINGILYIISRYDYDSTLIPQYPRVQWPSSMSDYIRDNRGGSSVPFTMVTEEMMCKIGTQSRIQREVVDYSYREFDQVTHEMGHTLDAATGQNGGSTPYCYLPNPYECYAASVQSWFDNCFSYSMSKNREIMRTTQPALYQYIAKGFSNLNTWLPPRYLHQREFPFNEFDSIMLTDVYYSSNQNYKINVQIDGNLVIRNRVDLGFVWGTYNNLNISLKVKSAKFDNGYLSFLDASNVVLFKVGSNAPGSRLVFDEIPSGPALNIVDANGNVIWSSNSQVEIITSYSISPIEVPVTGGTKIRVNGYYWNCGETYSCNFQGTIGSATCIDSSLLICTTPMVTNPQNITLEILNSGNDILRSISIVYRNTDICYEDRSICTVHGDPHFVPFCNSKKVNYDMQPTGVLNLVTSLDRKFQVLGRAVTLNSNPSVSVLNAISIIGLGLNGRLSARIVYDSSININIPKVTLNDTDITSKLPYTTNGIKITNSSVSFPGNESVYWNGPNAIAEIYLPGAQYWKNVEGLCGYLDESKPYCIGSNKQAWGLALDKCANSWKILSPSFKRSIEQDSNAILDNITYDDNSTANTPFVLTDNFITNTAKSICNTMFDAIEELCPPNNLKNLQNYQESCIYDGAAIISYQLDQIAPDLSVESFNSFVTSVQNIAKLGETVLSVDTFSIMMSSVKSGIANCFYNETQQEFNADAFHSALPKCQSYCKFPGSKCSSTDECQFSLTVSDLVTLANAGPTALQINVVLFIACLLLSIW